MRVHSSNRQRARDPLPALAPRHYVHGPFAELRSPHAWVRSGHAGGYRVACRRTVCARQFTVGHGASSVPEQGTITVHVTGTSDENELAWTAFVQNQACPATLQEAQNQPDEVKQNKTQLSQG